MYSNLNYTDHDLTLPVHQAQENHQDEHHIQEINDIYLMMLSIVIRLTILPLWQGL